MYLGKRLARLIRAGRADISAWLLIAFIFQLIVPICVFAVEAKESDFQSALRHSICRIAVISQISDQPQERHQTDNFVCDWCVASCDRALLVDLSLDDLVPLPQRALHVRGEKSRNLLSYSSLHKYITPPRAPPFLIIFS
jgi:hypothetical protein